MGIKIEYNGDKMKALILKKTLLNKEHDKYMPIRYAAKLIGISPATFFRISKGKEPDVVTLFTVCDWLGVSAETFIKKYKTK